MSDWQPIETAPKDKHILLYGAQDDSGCSGVTYLDPFVFSGYWDDIDGAWCAHGTTFNGPFFHCTHWKPLDAPPEIPVALPLALGG